MLIRFFRDRSAYLKNHWFSYVLDTIVVIVGILIALAVNNWNTDRINKEVEHSTLIEILNGLQQDLEDIDSNLSGHHKALRACKFWRRVINNEKANTDSTEFYYHVLTRDYVTIFNKSGYESLKSRGLDLITNDSLRIEIISLYEIPYYYLNENEEERQEMQYHRSYFIEINKLISPYFIFNKKGEITSIQQPLMLTEDKKKLMLTYLRKIEYNRRITVDYYNRTKQKIYHLIGNIENQLKKRT